MTDRVPDLPSSVDVPFTSLLDVAVQCWRLRRWLSGPGMGAAGGVGRHVARELERFLCEREIAAIDVTGQPYDPGLAVEVVDTIQDSDAPEGTGVIEETVTPIIAWRGAVVRHGQVVTRYRASKADQHRDRDRCDEPVH